MKGNSNSVLFVPTSCADCRGALFFYLCIIGGIIITFQKVYPGISEFFLGRLTF